jgi:predicted lipoprotein with Yx(FWY)xxD motif
MTYRSIHHRTFALTTLAVAASASIFLAACSSSSKAASTGSATTVAPAAASSPSNASVTVKAATVPGVGKVLVDGNGRTLYVLASEQGGSVSCVAANGCTAIWPALVLPPGMSQGIAGSGVQASLLGTTKGPAGDVRLTYGGWPLYTFKADTGSGMTKGQALTDTWGLWWVLSPSGNPVKTAASTAPASTPTSAPQSGGAGF